MATDEGRAKGAGEGIAGESAHDNAPLFFVVFIFVIRRRTTLAAIICEALRECQSQVIR
jgi:hypothetical protein